MSLTLSYDVLVIGSGAGGGVIAERLSRLCAEGARIAIVEAGPWYGREHFTMRESEMMKLFIDRGAVPSQSFDVAVTAAECVGGSTSVYTGVTFRAPPGVVADWSRSYGLDELTEQDIQARFQRLESEINAHVPGREYENTNNRIFREACERRGFPVKEFKVNILDCQKCGFCNLGCPYGAKRGTLEVQVPSAVSRGVEVIPNCRIERVADGHAWGVIEAAPAGTKASAHAPGSVRFDAKLIVVAAGALSSSALLLRSELPGLSPACGRYVTVHPALTSFARMPFEVRGFDGFPKLYYTDQFSESEHYYIETAFYFPFVTAKSLPGFGADIRRFMRAYPRLACALTLVHDEAEEHNRILWHKGRRVLDYRLSDASKRAIVHAQRSVGDLYFGAGAAEYVSLVSDRFSVASAAELEGSIHLGALVPGKVVVSSAHPMGGCRMGRDPNTSVTNEWGEVHGYPNIVVADASLFPTSTKVNPYLTIMAFADRIAERLALRLTGRSAEVPARQLAVVS